MNLRLIEAINDLIYSIGVLNETIKWSIRLWLIYIVIIFLKKTIIKLYEKFTS